MEIVVELVLVGLVFVVVALHVLVYSLVFVE